MLDWTPIETLLGDIHAAAKGEPAWPPQALFKAMLIAVWYDLSDVKRAEILDGSGFVPAVWRLLNARGDAGANGVRAAAQGAVAYGLDKVLFEAVTRQLRAKGDQCEDQHADGCDDHRLGAGG